MSRDEFIQHNVHLRKLNQPFEWHSQGPGSNPDEVVEKNNVLNNETTQENTKKKPTTCRNSVQGKIWIADDQGKNFSTKLMILNPFNRSSRRKRGMASNPLFIYQTFFAFSKQPYL